MARSESIAPVTVEQICENFRTATAEHERLRKMAPSILQAHAETLRAFEKEYRDQGGAAVVAPVFHQGSRVPVGFSLTFENKPAPTPGFGTGSAFAVPHSKVIVFAEGHHFFEGIEIAGTPEKRQEVPVAQFNADRVRALALEGLQLALKKDLEG